MPESKQSYEEVRLIDLWRAVRCYRITFLSVLFLTQAASLAIAFILTPTYRAEVLVSAVTDSSEQSILSSMRGQLGGLASLVGFSSPAESRAEALAVLKSRALTERFISENNLLPVLYADKWDSASGSWKSEYADDVPTIRDAVSYFSRNVRKVIEDTKTGLISVRVEWTDNEQAAVWANSLIDIANNAIRSRAISEAEQSIKYLNEQLQETSIVGLEEAIYGLIEDNIRTIMFAHVRKDFAFKVIDPAISPEQGHFARPNKLAIALFGFLLGVTLGGAAVAMRSVAKTIQAAD